MVAAAKRVVRGADELEFLASRQRTSPVDPRVVREKANGLVRRVIAFDEELGAEAHDQGTGLVELYFQHVDLQLGFKSFAQFLDAHWPLDRSNAYERMRIAKLCSRETARKYGYTACVLGLRIMRAKGIATFPEFLKTPLPLHPDEGGGTVRFPATVVELRSVLRALAIPVQQEPDTDVGEQLRRYRIAVDSLRESDPGIAEISPVVWADAKGAYVRVTASGKAQAKAAARLYAALARIGT